MSTERLIEEIRKFDVIYDPRNDKYKNPEYKDKIWKIISMNVGANWEVEECKRRWNSVRDQLRRTLQKRKTKFGQSAEKQRKYKYEDNLTFLVPFVTEKESQPRVPSLCEDENMDNGSDLNLQDNLIYTIDLSQEQQDNKEQPVSNNGTTSPPPTPAELRMAGSATTRTFTDREPQDSSASQLISYILAEKEADRRKLPFLNHSNLNAVDAFLCDIGATLKTLDPILLNKTKAKIFQLVNEAELWQLRMNETGQGGCDTND